LGASKIGSGDFICSARSITLIRSNRILKLPLCLDNIQDVANLFICCCALHNMLLLVDRPFDDGQPTAAEVLGNTVSSRHYNPAGAGADVTITNDLDVSGVGTEGAPPMWLFQDGSSEALHFVLLDKLALHYNLCNPSRAQAS